MDSYEHQDFEHQRLVSLEAQRLADARMNSFTYKFTRFVVRSLRVACGMALAFVGFIILWNTEGLSDVPFAQLTLGMLVSHAATLIFALALIWWAFVAAFGAPPQ